MTDELFHDPLLRVDEAAVERYCESFEIVGGVAQAAKLVLRRGQSMWVQRGGLLSYSPGIEWALRIPGGAAKALGRMLGGAGLALTHVTCQRERGMVTVSANHAGRLATWDLSRGPIVCTRGSLVAAVGEVDIDVTVARSPGAALFGGAGLFLQRISGNGIAIVHGAGDFIEEQLRMGETLLVSSGNLAVFSASVQYDVRGVGGCLKVLFGGEGLFMTQLRGPGWVMLQTMKKQSPARRQMQRDV